MDEIYRKITLTDLAREFPLAWDALLEDGKKILHDSGGVFCGTRDPASAIARWSEDMIFIVTAAGRLEHHGHPCDPRAWIDGKWEFIPNRFNL